jgi:hypothetical protein
LILPPFLPRRKAGQKDPHSPLRHSFSEASRPEQNKIDQLAIKIQGRERKEDKVKQSFWTVFILKGIVV